MTYEQLREYLKEHGEPSADLRARDIMNHSELGKRIYCVFEALSILFPLQYLEQAQKMGYRPYKLVNVPLYRYFMLESYAHTELINILEDETGGIKVMLNNLLGKNNNKLIKCLPEDRPRLMECQKQLKQIIKKYSNEIKKIHNARNKYYSHIDSNEIPTTRVGAIKMLEIIVRISKIYKDLIDILDIRVGIQNFKTKYKIQSMLSMRTTYLQ